MIKNFIELNNTLIITLDNGNEIKCVNYDKNIVDTIRKNPNISKDELYCLIDKKYKTRKKINKSSILTLKGDSAYIYSVSNLSVPRILVEKIIEAEENNDNDALTAYKNFWTLLSLNPNSAVRDNLFWFLERWGMSICKSGLFVAYRNVELKSEGIKYNKELTEFVSEQYYKIKNDNQNPSDYKVYIINNEYFISKDDVDDLCIGNLKELYENIVFTSNEAGTVYTDNYTRKMEIRLGHIVSIPRKDCDEDVNKQCSSGLHAGAKGWLKYNYCGNIGLKVLVNPTDVCSCPKADYYGKLRTCAYYPIQVIKFDSNGNVSDTTVPDGFEVDFLYKICYDGTVNNEDNDNYSLDLNYNFENKESIFKNLKSIAETINRKV